MKYSNELLLLGKEAKEAAKVLASLDSEDRNRSLYKIAENLMLNKEQILIANKKDCEEAISIRLDDSLIDRIYLDDKRLSDIAKDVITIAELPDPLDEIFDMKKLIAKRPLNTTLNVEKISKEIKMPTVREVITSFSKNYKTMVQNEVEALE